MAFNLSRLLQDTYRKLGQTDTFLATGGSATTIVNSSFKEKYQDDDLTGWSAFVTRDAGGASAAPEDEFRLVSIYSESTWTITVAPAFSVAPAVGDRITLANGIFPVEEMIQLANMTLEELGDFTFPETSLTTVDGQKEYAIALGTKRKIIRIEIADDADDSGWKELQPFRYTIVPATAGSTGLLVFNEEPVPNRSLKIWYRGSHPYVTDYDDIILEYIHPTLAVNGLAVAALEWFNSRISGSEDYWLAKLNDARREFDIAKITHKTEKPGSKNRMLVVGE